MLGLLPPEDNVPQADTWTKIEGRIDPQQHEIVAVLGRRIVRWVLLVLNH